MLKLTRLIVSIIAPKKELDVVIYIFVLSMASFFVSFEIANMSNDLHFSALQRTDRIREADIFIAKHDVINALWYAQVPIDPTLLKQALIYYEGLAQSKLDADTNQISNYLDYFEVIGENNFHITFSSHNNHTKNLENAINTFILELDETEHYLKVIQVMNILYALWLGVLTTRKSKKLEDFFNPDTPWF